jgi:hypothetical protein
MVAGAVTAIMRRVSGLVSVVIARVSHSRSKT